MYQINKPLVNEFYILKIFSLKNLKNALHFPWNFKNVIHVLSSKAFYHPQQKARYEWKKPSVHED